MQCFDYSVNRAKFKWFSIALILVYSLKTRARNLFYRCRILQNKEEKRKSVQFDQLKKKQKQL